ncbi:MAG: hypothetical protein AAGA33_00980 [Pseudomonadota bacterium]
MAERNMDKQDEFLTELFTSAPIADDGFSRRVLRRVRRQIWVDRLALPVAVIVGFAFAFKPLMQLSSIIPSLAGVLPVDSLQMPAIPAVDSQMLVLGGLLLFIVLFAAQAVED